MSDTNYLSMSDEQIMAMGGIAPEPTPATETVEQPVAAEPEQQPAEQEQAREQVNSDDATGADAETEAAGEDDAEAEASGNREGEETRQPAADNNLEVDEQQRPDAGGKEPVTKPEASNLPEGAERIFETFRANGRDMKVKSVDEAIRLMQMGANYSQNRAAAKKDRAFVRVLEDSGLNDHEKLAFAVDLVNGKPEAIAKLLKERNFDVHSLEDIDTSKYKAQSLAPSANQLDLDDVVSEIKGHKQFDRLLSDMRGWDEQSQAMLGQRPAALRQLTQQMESGVYDTIMDEVHRRQVLGDLDGVPVMQAYNEIGQEMAEAGKFIKPAPKGPVKKLVTPGKKPSRPSAADEERRRAAAPSKGASTVEAPKKIDFLSMSDADFAKYVKQ